MLKKTSGSFAYINIFKRYSAFPSNYEKENMPSNTLICRIGNTLRVGNLPQIFECGNVYKVEEIKFAV